jgi:hypothetical protein
MEEFTIQGQSDFLKLSFEDVFGFPNKTCHWGGYDTKAILEIKSGNYYVKGILCTSTGELFEFFEQLKDCNDNVEGFARFISYQQNLDLTADYDKRGHVRIFGTFSEYSHDNNELKFEFSTDQTFINNTLNELQIITSKYGGMKGLIN